MPQRLTGMDASFLYGETATGHMHVASVLVLDPSTRADGRLTHDDVTDYLRQRLHLAPVFRRRLAWVPLNLDHPVWVEDPDFDLGFHVRRAALPAPGGLRQLAEFAGDVMSRPIDRSRPLWELWVVENLEGGRVALVGKTHHAAVDGVSGIEMTAALFQLEPSQEAPPPTREWHPERPPGDVRLLVEAGVRLAARPWAGMRLVRRALGPAVSLLGSAVRGRGDGAATPFAAPMTVINGAIGAHRRPAFIELPLEDLKRVKRALGGTVNDVVLAVVSGALRRFLQERGEVVDRPLVAMVPISVRPPDHSGEPGNHVSAMLVSLPTDEADPVEALRRVSADTAGAKEQYGALGATTVQELAELAPAGLSSLAARLYSRWRAADLHRPIWNTVVSNVPGPRFPLYCAGARLEAMYPLGPCHEGVGLNITLFSYLDLVYVGLNADRDMVPDADRIGVFMVEVTDQLVKAVRGLSGV